MISSMFYHNFICYAIFFKHSKFGSKVLYNISDILDKSYDRSMRRPRRNAVGVVGDRWRSLLVASQEVAGGVAGEASQAIGDRCWPATRRLLLVASLLVVATTRESGENPTNFCERGRRREEGRKRKSLNRQHSLKPPSFSQICLEKTVFS